MTTHEKGPNWMVIIMMMILLSFWIWIASLLSCSPLTKTQRMERDMFDPQPTRLEKVQIRKDGVTLPDNYVKMPKRRKK